MIVAAQEQRAGLGKGAGDRGHDGIENVIAGTIATAIAWLSALAWSHRHRSKENTA
ncbi:hypothetical protein ABZ387_31655 [Streptomyces flaveolus]|uniref:hypothetical protein n=1 Tax=Streptomyces flaveolus TaxID=67297 RepID=UPI003400A2DF